MFGITNNQKAKNNMSAQAIIKEVVEDIKAVADCIKACKDTDLPVNSNGLSSPDGNYNITISNQGIFLSSKANGSRITIDEIGITLSTLTGNILLEQGLDQPITAKKLGSLIINNHADDAKSNSSNNK